MARQLADAGFAVVINSAPGEENLAEEIVRNSGGAARALTLDMAGLIAVTRRASLAIAGDTGPLHLACALGIPVVGIYGPTDPGAQRAVSLPQPSPAPS